MKILIAPNALKGTLSASETGAVIKEYMSERYPKFDLKIVPVADGGDGTCFLLGKSMSLPIFESWSLDAVGRSKKGFFYIDKESKTAFLDVSTVSGIGNLDESLMSPRNTSTYGTGLMIQKAVDQGAKEIVMGLGGSATIDLGLGILQGLGFVFLNNAGREIPAYSDSLLKDLAYIIMPIPQLKINFKLLCDVQNIFSGEWGAIPVFGPQKGLKQGDFGEYEKDSLNALKILYEKAKKSFQDQQGFGAAGGIAAGLSAFFPTEIVFGAPYFFERVKLQEEVDASDLVITAEGKYDDQSKEGKACYELMKLCQKSNKEIFLISSGTEGKEAGFSDFFQLPELDFQSQNLKEEAVEGLKNTLRKLVDKLKKEA